MEVAGGFWAADARLLATVDRSIVEAARRAGPSLACRAGCTECCIGPFPISALDAQRLSRGLAILSARDPEKATRLRARAAAVVAAVSPGFPGDLAVGEISDDEGARDRFFANHEALPCPALDLSTGLCDLYAHRPLACRTHGPPVRIGTEALPQCRLCFVAASESFVEQCRVDVDCGGEEPLLDQLERAGASAGETLVAFALLPSRPKADR